MLIDGEHTVCDSQAITDHLEEAYPETPLLGQGAAQRNETRRLVAWFDTKFNREVTELLWREQLVKRWAKRGFPRSEVMREGCAEHPLPPDLHRLPLPAAQMAGRRRA